METMEMEIKMETEMEIEMETESKTTKTDEFTAQNTDGTSTDRHYSHERNWPPQQQYKSKNWTIAIILKSTLVAWDSWTYQIGF